MIKYQKREKFDPKKLNPQNIDRLSIDLIPKNSKVLEIGCATGFMGRYLREAKNCNVTGVDVRKEEAEIAIKYLNRVLIGDMGSFKFVNSISEKYDVILAQAVIQQIIDPSSALILWKKLLKKNGILVISASNIAHWTIRSDILLGRFNYRDYGLMDENQIRFYTISTFKNLIENSGYKIIEFKIDSEGGGYPKFSMQLSKLFPGLFTYQMLILAKSL